mmetsp:Transcript_68963/g.173699  ORF Transcript_68963/g.173699 Transcript_68963/m.173699 type:complete len:254 (+) Transcript_68963:194-955(+)
MPGSPPFSPSTSTSYKLLGAAFVFEFMSTGSMLLMSPPTTSNTSFSQASQSRLLPKSSFSSTTSSFSRSARPNLNVLAMLYVTVVPASLSKGLLNRSSIERSACSTPPLTLSQAVMKGSSASCSLSSNECSPIALITVSTPSNARADDSVTYTALELPVKFSKIVWLRSSTSSSNLIGLIEESRSSHVSTKYCKCRTTSSKRATKPFTLSTFWLTVCNKSSESCEDSMARQRCFCDLASPRCRKYAVKLSTSM